MPESQAREPHRPLHWPDIVYRLQSIVADESQPVYLVGGAVRDALRGRPVHDIDLTLARGGIRLARRLADALDGDFFPLDRERDVGRVLVDVDQGRLLIDAARFRGPDLRADLADRDFTVNAMAVELAQDCKWLIDPLGGEEDLRARRLRQCQAHSLGSDPLRALRALRLAAQFGLHIEKETLASIRNVRNRLTYCSAERLRDELWRLLALPRASAAIRVAAATGVLEGFLPETVTLTQRPSRGGGYANAWQECLAVVERMQLIVSAFDTVQDDQRSASFGVGMLVMQLDRWRSAMQQHAGTRWPDQRSQRSLLTFACLFSTLGEGEENAALALERGRALNLSNSECERLAGTLRWQRQSLTLDAGSDLALHRFWRGAGVSGVDACLLAAAVTLGEAGSRLRQEDWLATVDRLTRVLQAWFERKDTVIDPAPLLDGRTLMRELDLSPGPAVGELLRLLREAQVTGRAKSDEEALELARDYLRSRPH